HDALLAADDGDDASDVALIDERLHALGDLAKLAGIGLVGVRQGKEENESAEKRSSNNTTDGRHGTSPLGEVRAWPGSYRRDETVSRRQETRPPQMDGVV